MAITVDTHTLVWYMDKSLQSKLSSTALQMIQENEAKDIIYVPLIVLVEILYLHERCRITVPLMDVLSKIEKSVNYHPVPLDMDVLKIAQSLTGLEAHDRLILATAQKNNTPLISKDKELREYGVHVIW